MVAAMADRSPGTLLVWLVAAVLGGAALLRLTGGGEGEARPPVRIAGASVAADRGAAAAGNLVHVAGAVRRPGLVRVPEGARVAIAVRRAGGPAARADLNALNLAARVDDGQQVVVPRAGPGGAGAAGDKPSLGTATVEELDGIDGIGPTLAQRIVEHRTKSGGFGSPAELRAVDGIGEKRLEALREALQP
jgi:competence protein ComEA